MAEHRQLRSATLEILGSRDEHTIGIGALVKALQRRGYGKLQTLWKELSAMEREELIQSSGPPSRRTIHLVEAPAPVAGPRPRPNPKPPAPRHETAPRPAPPRSPAPAPEPAEFPELEDPATFVEPPRPAPAGAQVPTPAEPEAITEAELAGETAAAMADAELAANAEPTRFKGLTRCDYPEQHLIGFMVRVNWKGQRRQAFFSDKKYGGRLEALDEALKWRNAAEAELGKPRTEQQVIGTTASNTGVQGVTRTLREGHPTFQVTWYENGRQRRRTVNIARYGEAKALEMAKEIRAEAERRRLGGEAFAFIREHDR